MSVKSAKWFGRDHVLFSFLDLCGTKSAYSHSPVKEQVKRISQVVRIMLEVIDDVFDKCSDQLFAHMYADSLIIAEKESGTIEQCPTKLLNVMHKIQYRILIDSEMNIPTLSRALITRGQYYGMIFHESKMKIEGVFSNFSLVGGSRVVEADKILRKLPMGVYIADSIRGEVEVDGNRLLDVSRAQPNDSHLELKFVKPPGNIDFLRSIFHPCKTIDDWGKLLVELSGNDQEFEGKLMPWIDAIQGRRHQIDRETPKR